MRRLAPRGVDRRRSTEEVTVTTMGGCQAGGITAPAPDGVVELPDLDWQVACKTVTDFLLAGLLLLGTLPLMALAMALVMLTSRGPVIYSQTRVGRHGRPFTIFKIRTMYLDCERLTGPVWSTGNDPRVIPVGRFLRSTHLDELPQLWNVLRGDMSLVGPRPERPEFVAQLEKQLPRYRERLRVRPGVTGLAQLQLAPDTHLESVRRKLECDLDYLRRLSPWLDVRILLGTCLSVVGVPFAVTRAILRIPGAPSVPSRPVVKEAGPVVPSEAVPVPQVQSV
jgi:lipopolysaccharide/colanic/teichoic acid biosynthesis glycosyltransferase